jgi:hypothetical protein
MTPEQLLEALRHIPSMQYTLTGAADWPILAAMCGVLAFIGVIFVALVGFMWKDLRSLISQNRSDGKDDLLQHATSNTNEFRSLWSALKDCQGDCCPRGERQHRKGDE